MTSSAAAGDCSAPARSGHAGTLDPMATGVLVIGIERATKILGLLSGTTKIVFGDDPAGPVHLHR